MSQETPYSDLPLHTNRVVALKKKNRRPLSGKLRAAMDTGNPQSVIDSLTPLQLRFCEEFLIDLKPTEAVKRAGYQTVHPSKIAYQLMENSAIRVAIDALRAERMKNSDVTKDFVLLGIQRAIRTAEEAGNVTATLRGYELLAKHLGMFVERQEISGPDGEAIKYEQKVREEVNEFTNKIARLAEVKND